MKKETKIVIALVITSLIILGIVVAYQFIQDDEGDDIKDANKDDLELGITIESKSYSNDTKYINISVELQNIAGEKLKVSKYYKMETMIKIVDLKGIEH